MRFARFTFIGAGIWAIVVLMPDLLLAILFMVAFAKTLASGRRDV
jgi:hypothetical protein